MNKPTKKPRLHPFDNSQISTFQTCEMSFFLQYVLGLKHQDKMEDTTLHIDFGDKFHKFLERYYKREKGIIIKDIWKDFYDREGEYGKTQRGGEFLCEQYHLKWAADDRDLDILGVEDLIELEISGYKFVVKVDMVYQKNGSIYGREHKTGKNIGYNFFDKYQFINSQVSAQYAAIEKKYGSCDGIEINAAEIKALARKPSADYDGIEPFTKNDGKTAWRTAKYRRDFATRMPGEIEDWQNNVVQWIKRMERSKTEKSYAKSDGLWSGIICANCEYRDLCKVSNGMALNESVKDLFYTEVDPYEYLRD